MNPFANRSPRQRLMTGAALGLLAAACGDLRPPHQEPQVVLAISTVPADVSCLRLTAAGPGRTFSREVEAMPGASIDEAFSGLPLGTVNFLAEAFPASCTSVSKATIATWISDPAQAAVVVGRLATVALTLHRNGRAKVSVDFVDEPLCQPAGATCITDLECCSHACTRGACEAGGDAGAPPDAR
jgi:hypothetical protein